MQGCNCSRCNGDGPEDNSSQEWLDENTTYEMGCCGASVDYDDLILLDNNSIAPRRCDACSLEEGKDVIECVNEIIPDSYDMEFWL